VDSRRIVEFERRVRERAEVWKKAYQTLQDDADAALGARALEPGNLEQMKALLPAHGAFRQNFQTLLEKILATALPCR